MSGNTNNGKHVVFLAFDESEEAAAFLRAVQREKLVGYPVHSNGKRRWHPAKLLVAYRSGVAEEKLANALRGVPSARRS